MGFPGQTGKAQGRHAVAGAQNIGGALGHHADQALPDGQDTRFDKRFEPCFLVLEPRFVCCLAQALFFRFEAGGNFLLDRFAGLDNLLLAPHAIGWTSELFRDIGAAACRGMLDLSLGRQPSGVLNPELFGRREFLDKWAAVIGRDVPVAR